MKTFRIACVLATVAALACSNNNNNDAGTDSGGEASANNVNQTGTIVAFQLGTPVSDTFVSGAGATATTDGAGNYTLSVPKNTNYTMQVVAGVDAGTNYVSLNEQEWMLTGNANRGKTSFVPATTQGLLQAILQPKPDPTLAVLSISVYATGACAADAGGADIAGATISVPGLTVGDAGNTGGPVLTYFSGGFPSSTTTSVQPGQLPSAIVYNLTPTAAFNQVTVKHPTCKQKPFPVNDLSDPNIVYSGNVRLDISYPTGQPAVVSFMRVFLE